MTDISVQMPVRSRRTLRRAMALCLLLMPPAGAWLMLSAGPDPGYAAGWPVAMMIWSAALHLLLTELSSGRGQESVLSVLMTSGITLMILPGMPLTGMVAPDLKPGGDESGAGAPLVLVSAWLLGMVAALLARALARAVPHRFAPGGAFLANPVQLLSGGLVLMAGLWLAGPLLHIGGRDWLALAPLAAAGLYALYILVLASLAAQGLEAMGGAEESGLPALSMLILAFLLVLSGLMVLLALPVIAPLGASGTLIVALMIALLVFLVLLHRGLVLFCAGSALLAASPAFAGAVLASGPALQLFYFCLLCALLAAGLRPARGQAGLTAAIGQPPDAALSKFHSVSRAWILRIDLDERIVYFPNGSGKSLGFGEIASFADVFAGADFTGVIDLMHLLQSQPRPPAGPVRLQLGLRAAPGDEGQPGRLLAFNAWVLSQRPPEAWIALVSLEREAELSQRVARYENMLSEAILREERLLSIASHELRTPVAILSMLGEELKAGASWEEIGSGFDTTLERIIGILDDLRAGSGGEGGQSAGRGFTLRELGEQVREIFVGSALGNGITLDHNTGETSDLQIQCDYNRIFVALSKLVHNAIVHSRSRNVVISAFLLRGSGEECHVTWQVADDGIGIAPDKADLIFEPFETGDAGPEGRPGLGLYTARKAMRLMGGDLTLSREGRGSRFVLSHPARILQKTARAEREVVEVSDVSPIYANRSVLLVEDNKLVGEITLARLRKLFPVVDWAESGDSGLSLFRENKYDLVVVDQLLPGLIGSELVREIRLTHKDLPVVGITASTMGSECRDLEAAGANYALEKPLSFGQLRALAEEFFGVIAAPPE